SVAEKVIGETRRKLRDRVRRRGCNDNEIGGLTDGDVPHLSDTLVEVGVHDVATHRLERGATHEAQRGIRRHNLHTVALTHESANDRYRLERRDSAGDPDDDAQRLAHGQSRTQPARGVMTSLPSLISCSDTERGLSSIVESTRGPTLSKRLPSCRSA